MVHCGSIRQTASITEMSAECLRTGDKAKVKFRFVKHPEYLQVREGVLIYLDINLFTRPSVSTKVIIDIASFNRKDKG